MPKLGHAFKTNNKSLFHDLEDDYEFKKNPIHIGIPIRSLYFQVSHNKAEGKKR